MAGAASKEIQVAAAVMERDGRFLITRRPEGSHLGGLWEFPGGKRLPGESYEACLRREILEELGIEVEVGDLLHETRHRYPERSVHLRFYSCRILGGEPGPIGVADLRWVPAAELNGYRFPPADTEILSVLGAAGGRRSSRT